MRTTLPQQSFQHSRPHHAQIISHLSYPACSRVYSSISSVSATETAICSSDSGEAKIVFTSSRHQGSFPTTIATRPIRAISFLYPQLTPRYRNSLSIDHRNSNFLSRYPNISLVNSFSQRSKTPPTSQFLALFKQILERPRLPQISHLSPLLPVLFAPLPSYILSSYHQTIIPDHDQF